MKKALKIPLILLIIFITAGLLPLSCANRTMIEYYQPLWGEWRTDRNIILSINQTPTRDVAAVIKTSPGYLGDETKPGRVIISDIKPLVDGGYSGMFLMPGNQKPVKVKLALENRDTLIIVSWDRRVKGNIQQWTRVKRQIENH